MDYSNDIKVEENVQKEIFTLNNLFSFFCVYVSQNKTKIRKKILMISHKDTPSGLNKIN